MVCIKPAGFHLKKIKFYKQIRYFDKYLFLSVSIGLFAVIGYMKNFIIISLFQIESVYLMCKQENRKFPGIRVIEGKKPVMVIESGSFSRAVALPVKVDVERISAKLINGILTVTLMKAAEATARQIRVNAE